MRQRADFICPVVVVTRGSLEAQTPLYISPSAAMSSHRRVQPGDAPLQQITLTAEELVDGRALGAASLRSASHIGSVWRVRRVTIEAGFVIFTFQHAERSEVFMTTRVMSMEMW